MPRLNSAFASLASSYLFSEIAARVRTFQSENPGKTVISLGIGDVSQPLVPAVLEALHKATDEMGDASSFRGYGPEQGYAFLRRAILEHDFLQRGIDLDEDEIFISDGAKSDVGNFQEMFSPDAVIAVTDPVYPVYVDSNAMSGRCGAYAGGKWSRIIYLPCTAENGFEPDLPESRPDVIYLCSPNNPTGTVLSRNALRRWVDYARRNDSLIMFDAAYESFITDPGQPRSIYEIEGADEVAVEFRSFSKTAGFTGLRCAYAIVPKKLKGAADDGSELSLHAMWLRRQTTKYNGCPYVVQRAAEAVFSPAGQAQIAHVLGIYRGTAALMRKRLGDMGLSAFGGVHSPYVWLQTPDGMKSWDFFDLLLKRAAVVCTPGAGFGASGEHYVRMTAFNSPENTRAALDRLAAVV